MNKKIKKQEVEARFRDLIRTQKITEQADLQQQMAVQGHQLSQATISRMIQKLGVVKKNGVYTLLQEQNPFSILSIAANDAGIIVIKTLPGQAQGVGAFLDAKYGTSVLDNPLKDIILGLVAGDDTLFVVVSKIKFTQKALDQLKKDFA